MATVVEDSGRVGLFGRAVYDLPTSRWGADARIAVPALAIGGAIVAGMAWNYAPLTIVASLAAIVVALAAPAIGLATIVFMGPLAPPLVLPPPGFNAILVWAAVLGCIYRLPIDRPRITLTVPMLLLVAYVLYVGAQQTPDMVAGYAGSAGYVSYSHFRELLTGFGAILVAGYVLARWNPYPFLGIALGSAVFSAGLAIIPFINAELAPLIAGLTDETSIQRGIGSFGNPNHFGVFEALAIVTAVGLMIDTHSTRLRLVLLGTTVVLVVALAISSSRGGAVALAVGLACLAFSRLRARDAAVITVGLLAAGIVLYPILIEWRLSITNPMASADAYSALAQSDEGRLRAMLAGLQLFLTSPLFGIGWGQYASMSSQFAGPGYSLVAHNWYLSVLAEQGIVGIVLTILLLLAVVTALRARPLTPRSIGLGVLGAYAAGLLFLEAPTVYQMSALPILVLVAALVSDWTRPLWTNRRSASDFLAVS